MEQADKLNFLGFYYWGLTKSLKQTPQSRGKRLDTHAFIPSDSSTYLFIGAFQLY